MIKFNIGDTVYLTGDLRKIPGTVVEYSPEELLYTVHWGPEDNNIRSIHIEYELSKVD